MSSVPTGKNFSDVLGQLKSDISNTVIDQELDLLRLSNLLRTIFKDFATIAAASQMLEVNYNKFILEVIMTVLTMYRAFPVKGDLDISSIVNPGSGFDINDLESEIRESVQQLFSHLTDEVKSSLLRLLNFQVYHSNKASPNGNISEDWIADTAAVLNSPLYETVLTFVRQLNNSEQALIILEDIKSRVSDLATNKKHSKISYFQEGGGKIRIIAVVDWITQSSLIGLHQLTQGLLKSLPNDGTFSHSLSFVKACNDAANHQEAISVDLSAATDRFPVIFQECVLKHIMITLGLDKSRAEKIALA